MAESKSKIENEIETERLVLRSASAADVDTLHALWTDPDVRRYLWDDKVIDRSTAVEVVEESLALHAEFGIGQFLVHERSGGAFIGFAGLSRFDYFEDGESRIEILYGFYPAHWGKGYAREAARALLHHGFERCGIERIYAGADEPNKASFAVMRRVGMEFDRRTATHEGGPDALYYVINRERFAAQG